MAAKKMASLQRELEQLEVDDPNVGAAAKKYDETVRDILVGKVPRKAVSHDPSIELAKADSEES